MRRGVYINQEKQRVYVGHRHVFYFFRKAVGYVEDGTVIKKRKDLKKLIPWYTQGDGFLDFLNYNNHKSTKHSRLRDMLE